jgi:hypothetical protein
MWTEGEEVQQIDGGHGTRSSRLGGGRGMVTRAMIEAKYGVGLYWEERQNGVGWEVLVHQFEDASVPTTAVC